MIKRLETIWQQLNQPKELPQEERQLLHLATTNLQNAYAPYSKFQVGAAVHLENNQMIGGSNQENAAYPMCRCAEQVALSAAASQFPGVPITKIAVTVYSEQQTIDTPAMPCGSCRQMLAETEYRQKKSIKIIVRGTVGPIYIFNSVKEILPFSFNGSFL